MAKYHHLQSRFWSGNFCFVFVLCTLFYFVYAISCLNFASHHSSTCQSQFHTHTHNRLKIFAFWSEESRLSSETLPRLTQLLPVLYSERAEPHFLHHSTHLLLELTSRSPDFNRSLFDSPLSECKFEVGEQLGMCGTGFVEWWDRVERIFSQGHCTLVGDHVVWMDTSPTFSPKIGLILIYAIHMYIHTFSSS